MATSTPHATSKPHLLIVDDEPMIARLLKHILRSRCDVSVCVEGPEALKTLQNGERFDFIFCDLLMPRVTGMNIHEWLMAHAPEQAQRMAFMTGGACTMQSKLFLESLTTPIINKPFEMHEIYGILDNITHDVKSHRMLA